MEDQFLVDRGSCSTAREGYEAILGVDSNRPGEDRQFVNELHGLLGDDSEPDSLFFVESWTLGTSAAVENFQQRRQEHADRESQNRSFREFDNRGSLFFVQQSEWFAEQFGSAHHADWAQPPEEPAVRTQEQAPQEWGSFAEERDSRQETTYPMTQYRACRLLGVNATSTREQIKAAYRRMASQWHPDRLECRTEEVRQLATEKMVAINEAYRVLRS